MATKHKQDKGSSPVPSHDAGHDAAVTVDAAVDAAMSAAEAEALAADKAVATVVEEVATQTVETPVTEPAPMAAPVRQVGKTGAVAAGAFAGGLFGLAAGLGAPYLERLTSLPIPANPQIEQLAAKFGDLEKKLPAADVSKLPGSLKTLEDRLGQVEKGLVAAQSGAETRVKALEPQIAAVKSQADALGQKLADMNKAGGAQGLSAPLPTAPVVSAPATDGGAVVDLLPVISRLAKTEETLAALASRRNDADATLGPRIAGLEQGLSGVQGGLQALKNEAAGDTSPAILAVVALARRQFDAGRSLEQPVAALRALGAPAAMLAGLQPFAAQPVPTSAALNEKLKGLIASFPKPQAAAKPDDGLMNKLWAGAGKLIEVRSVGSAKVLDNAGIEAQIRAKAATGDSAGVTALVETLPAEQKSILKPWLDLFAARLQASAALDSLESDAARAIAKTPKKN